MTRVLRSWCAVWLSSAAVCGLPARAQSQMAIAGVGTMTCAEIAQLYATDPTNAGLIFQSWSQGYMSGANAELLQEHQLSDDLQRQGFGSSEQWAFERTYCDQHPLTSFFQAVAAARAQLMRQGRAR